ncbi:hypothetical protein E2C01_047989 [Portunus trituberculatus]|uniref:Uncharacterized protein n=1 Tax=Portunus trituberculatus TaxID=210409 RepID=A0A5B7G537_PORTR|nr:hypothetical protein [Portunus trituberculatus]
MTSYAEASYEFTCEQYKLLQSSLSLPIPIMESRLVFNWYVLQNCNSNACYNNFQYQQASCRGC